MSRLEIALVMHMKDKYNVEESVPINIGELAVPLQKIKSNYNDIITREMQRRGLRITMSLVRKTDEILESDAIDTIVRYLSFVKNSQSYNISPVMSRHYNKICSVLGLPNELNPEVIKTANRYLKLYQKRENQQQL